MTEVINNAGITANIREEELMKNVKHGVRVITWYRDAEGELRIIMGQGPKAVKFIGGAVDLSQHPNIRTEHSLSQQVLGEMGIFPKTERIEYLGEYTEVADGGTPREKEQKGQRFVNSYFALEIDLDQMRLMSPDDDVIKFIDLPADEVAEKLSYESTRNVWLTAILPKLDNIIN